jgi:hypothetical protein
MTSVLSEKSTWNTADFSHNPEPQSHTASDCTAKIEKKFQEN